MKIMIAFVNGVLAETESDRAVIDVNGIGYNVFVSQMTLERLPAAGSVIKLYTYTSVREDAFWLFGFLSKDELNMFKMLIGVSGIGPKGALSVLSVLTPDDIRFAILSADAKAIAKAPGVGKKTAERLVMELHDKISPDELTHGVENAATPGTGTGSFALPGVSSSETDAVQALVALGYNGADAMKAVRKVLSAENREDDAMTTEDILKKALKEIF